MKNNLKRILEERNISVYSLAVATGVHPQTLRLFARGGEYSPSVKILRCVARELQVAPIDILPDLAEVASHPDAHEWEPYDAEYSKCSRCGVMYPINDDLPKPVLGCQGGYK